MCVGWNAPAFFQTDVARQLFMLTRSLIRLEIEYALFLVRLRSARSRM